VAQEGNRRLSYLALFAVVAAGVTIGNLASGWIGAQLTALDAGRALADLSKSATAGAARARDAAVAQAQSAAGAAADPLEYAREQRRGDRQGVRLYQTCDEWRKAHAQLKTETTSAEMKRHCGLYDRYVEHGVLPGKK
jgi:hypothetical protein